jgi:threonine aldolase
MTRDYDSVSICFSKGMGAPVGSVLVGSTEFIARAHRWRKMFGGGWRQAGILAQACLFTLDNNIQRMEQDHERAKRIAAAINSMDAFSVDLDTVQTNMVYVTCEKSAHKVVEELQKHGIDLFDLGPNSVRIVCHLHIDDEDEQRIIKAFSQLS